MGIFQETEMMQSDISAAIYVEDGAYLSVNIFEWEGKGVHIREPFKVYDVEINLYNKEGKRVDNWVTNIIWASNITASQRKKLAIKEAVSLLEEIKGWFHFIEINDSVTIYRKREDAEQYEALKSYQSIRLEA